MVIADASFWAAIFNASDAAHHRALKALELHQAEGFVTTSAVLAETCHILRIRRRLDDSLAFMDALAISQTKLFDPGPDLWAKAARLMRQYRNFPMDYADASLVLLAEHLGHGRILTTDNRDFGSYRWKNQYPFDNLLEESN